MPKRPIFVTGNQDKVDYLAKMLGLELEHHKVSLDEIQSANPREIVEHKVRQAYEILKQPVLVEDVSLSFTALAGLPGPFVKFFVDAPNGMEIMCRMLDGFDDRSAYATTTYGYFDGSEVFFNEGRIDGAVAQTPRGDGGYGWDKIFEPSGYDGRTRAELNADEDRETYIKGRDFEGLKAFLDS